jgi:hypothetical protein
LSVALATLIVVGIGSLFTAVAGVSAWRAASVSAKEARSRVEPYVTMGVPRQDYEHDSLTVPLKNLGLGPAPVVVLQAKDLDGVVVSARIGPGLAPMESLEHILFAIFWSKLDPPTWDEVNVEGFCEDATGKRHPIYAFGSSPLPYPSSDVESFDDDSTGETRANRAFELKRVGRAARDGDLIRTAYAWRDFWTRSERLGESGDEYAEWVRKRWLAFGLPDDLFFDAKSVGILIYRLESGQ